MSSEGSIDRREPEFVAPEPTTMTIKEKMMMEEAKLKAKYPNVKPGGPSGLLAKRLQRGQKYFDSGDYNMAKAKMNNPKTPLAPTEKMILQESIGDAIPTPESLPPRKPSIIQSKLAEGEFS